MLKIGVMVSGGGTNLQAILDAMAGGSLPGCRVVTVVSSKPGAGALDRAKKAGIPTAVFSRREYADMDGYDADVLRHMQVHGVQLIVLAGFLSMIGERLIDAYPQAILNVHPSLIPSFCGKGFYGITPHRKALEYGVKVSGATVHFVEADYDSGPIVFQKAVTVMEDDTPETLQQRVMEEAEWILLPEAIRLYATGKLQVKGRHVKILP